MCYTVSLIHGKTINSHNIRHTRIRNYTKAACKLHIDRDLPSPYSVPLYYISMVLKAVNKYEWQANHRDMIYDKMIHYMEKICPKNHQDSLETSLIDWIYLGRFGSFWSIEWCQKSSKPSTRSSIITGPVHLPMPSPWRMSSSLTLGSNYWMTSQVSPSMKSSTSRYFSENRKWHKWRSHSLLQGYRQPRVLPIPHSHIYSTASPAPTSASRKAAGSQSHQKRDLQRSAVLRYVRSSHTNPLSHCARGIQSKT